MNDQNIAGLRERLIKEPQSAELRYELSQALSASGNSSEALVEGVRAWVQRRSSRAFTNHVIAAANELGLAEKLRDAVRSVANGRVPQLPGSLHLPELTVEER